MDKVKYFIDLFESIPDYRKIILLVFLINDDKNFLKEIGFNERDINRLNLEFKNNLIEQHGDFSQYIKNEEESINEKILNK